MIYRAILFGTLLATAFAVSADNLYAGFHSSSRILIVGHLESLSRTDRPFAIEREDGRLEISNGCGYDTAVVRVESRLGGKYDLPEMAAHLSLGEFCESILQGQVAEYLLALHWDGGVWEIDPELSSRLLPDTAGNLWIAEPRLIEKIERAGGPKPQTVKFDQAMLENVAIGQERRRTATAETEVTTREWLKELRRLRPVKGGWPSNPLYFSKGVGLSEFRTWVAMGLAEGESTSAWHSP